MPKIIKKVVIVESGRSVIYISYTPEEHTHLIMEDVKKAGYLGDIDSVHFQTDYRFVGDEWGNRHPVSIFQGAELYAKKGEEQ